MQSLKYLILTLLIPSIAFGQQVFRNDEAFNGTGYVIGNGNHTNSAAAVDSNGRIGAVIVGGGSGLSQSVIPVSRQSALNASPTGNIKGTRNRNSDTVEAASTTTVLNLTGHAAKVGDIIKFRNGTNTGAEIPVCSVATNTVTLCSALVADPSLADIWINSPQNIASFGGDSLPAGGDSLAVAIDSGYQNAAATGILKLEDAGHTSGDAGVQMLGVVQGLGSGAQTILSSTSLDYVPPANNLYGASLIDWQYYLKGNGSTSPLTLEDIAVPADQAVVMAGGVAKSAIAQTVGATEDAAPLALDLGNRTVVTTAPSGEMLQGCNTAVVTNTQGTIVNAVASKFNFMTGFTCTNTGGVATRVIIEDGDGVDMATTFLPATSGYTTATFPSPGIRTNVVNKTIRVDVITTGASIICCVSGFVGVI